MSLLVAIGASGCSGPQAASPSVDGAPVVAIPQTSASASEPPVVEDRPEERRRVQSGWITEKNGSVHRASPVACDATIAQEACTGTESSFFCKIDADCKEGPHGKCTTGIGQIGAYCGCEYACKNDAECGEGKACVCQGTGELREEHSVCAPAHCTRDADCGDTTCGLSTYHNGCSEEVRLACHTKDDQCKIDMDCSAGGSCSVAAIGDGKGAKVSPWHCQFPGCMVGRPLVIDGEARSALPRERRDWRGELLVDASALSPATRRALLAHYTAMGALEHASIASFARFSLMLLSLGAPSELVLDAHRAALDEVAHARVAFAAASSIAGRDIGPDKLPEAAAPMRVSVAEFVGALVHEGCVGETLGAAEGLRASRCVRGDGLRAALEEIARDEERHAALAWRTLKWALDVFGAEARAAAERAFVSAFEAYERDPDGEGDACEELGLLSTMTLGALRRDVLSSVIEPCRRSLGLVAIH